MCCPVVHDLLPLLLYILLLLHPMACPGDPTFLLTSNLCFCLSHLYLLSSQWPFRYLLNQQEGALAMTLLHSVQKEYSTTHFGTLLSINAILLLHYKVPATHYASTHNTIISSSLQTPLLKLLLFL